MSNNISDALLLPVEMTKEEIRNKVLTNVIEMLTYRKVLERSDIEKNTKMFIDQHPDDDVYKIKNYHVKLHLYKISGLTKQPEIVDFVSKNKDINKILIVKDINMKIIFSIKQEGKYPNLEMFLEHEFLICLPIHVAINECYLLDEQEKNKVLESYKAKDSVMPKIYISDPITRYYNGNIGQMFKIIRTSEVSGCAPYYRIIVNGIIGK